MNEYRFRAELPDGRRYTLHTGAFVSTPPVLVNVMRGKRRDWYGKEAALVVEVRDVSEWRTHEPENQP